MNLRLPYLVAAVLLVVIGGVFALQGAGLLPSAVMHGKPEWLVIGIVLVAAGVFLGFRATARRPT